MDTPEWFDDAIRATQENYRRINTSKRVCRLCGHNIMVATDRVSKSEDHTLRNPYHPETYPFCACAQSLALNGVPGPGIWEDMAMTFHDKIAQPGTDEHRRIMLAGEPTRKIPELLIFGKTPKTNSDQGPRMNTPEFDRLLEERIAKAFNSEEPENDPYDIGGIALHLHAEILESRIKQLRRRDPTTQIEEQELAAFRQAYFCYSILNQSAFYEGVFCLMRGTLKHSDLGPFEMQNIARFATQSLNQLLIDFQREAERMLVCLGLPSTWDAFTDYGGNRCRIHIDLARVKPVPDDLFESFVIRFYGR